MATQLPGVDPNELSSHTGWLREAAAIERAHRMTIAWIRSRMPGYPNLHAPQLAQGSPLTTHEFTSRLIWVPGERAQGLQFVNPPTDIAMILEARGPLSHDVAGTAMAVAAALKRDPEWERFAAAGKALDSADRLALAAARQRIRDRLLPEKLDAYEPNLAVARAAYRSAAVDEEIAALVGAPAEYAEAFARANDLVEMAASDVFGQLTVYPVRSMTPTDLQFQPGEQTTLSFSVTPGVFPEPGMLAWLEDDLVEDAVQIDAFHMTYDATSQIGITLKANLLRNTGLAWRLREA